MDDKVPGLTSQNTMVCKMQSDPTLIYSKSSKTSLDVSDNLLQSVKLCLSLKASDSEKKHQLLRLVGITPIDQIKTTMTSSGIAETKTL